MSHPNPSTAMSVVIMDELVRNGVDFVVISPGSRSGGLALAADGNESVTVRVVIDERSAAFWALGRAKATDRPTAVISTSGTAAANFLPAVVEADLSLTPLVVLTADRPEELRGVGANQTIEQVGLYRNHVRFETAIEAPNISDDGNELWRSAVARAVGHARGGGGRAGAVHLNVAFREPTVPVSDDGRSRSAAYEHPTEGKEGGQPWEVVGVQAPPAPRLDIPEPALGIVIAGDGVYDRGALLSSARRLGWPVLATAESGLRGGDVLTAYHYMLAAELGPELKPEVAIVVGRVGPSVRLEQLIASANHRIRVDSSGRHIDPGRNATRMLQADPVTLLTGLAPDDSGGDWSFRWRRVEELVRASTSTHLGGLADPSGPGIAAKLNESSWNTLVVASSLPIRDIDAHLTKGGKIVANRGASGIDGFVSTALGVATSGAGTVALGGDLSVLHDSNGFLTDKRPDLVLVLVDNGGGGLFDLLPQRQHAPGFERLFVTPPGRSFARLADFHELAYVETRQLSDLVAIVAQARERRGITLVRVPVDRQFDLETRRSLDEIGARAARSADS